MVLLLLLGWLGSQASSASLHFTPPPGWIGQRTTSSMRVAEFSLPKTTEDPEDASLVLYFFGGQGGSAAANIDRWIGQMAQPDGRASKDLAKSSRLSVNGLSISIVDVSGTYVAETSPGSSDRFNKPAFRLKAAVIDTPGGPYFVKLTGPARTVAKWDDSFSSFLKSLRYE